MGDIRRQTSVMNWFDMSLNMGTPTSASVYRLSKMSFRRLGGRSDSTLFSSNWFMFCHR